MSNKLNVITFNYCNKIANGIIEGAYRHHPREKMTGTRFVLIS